MAAAIFTSPPPPNFAAARTICSIDGAIGGAGSDRCRIEGKFADPDRDFAVNIGVGDLAVGYLGPFGSRSAWFRRRRIGENTQDIICRIVHIGVFVRRSEGGRDFREGTQFYEVALALPGNGADLQDLS